MMTNKNKTAIAPIYTINIINPIKSAPKYINNILDCIKINTK